VCDRFPGFQEIVSARSNRCAFVKAFAPLW
jgi:hypothetical protein